MLADVGGAKDSNALSVRRHHSVFNSVVDHFDEVTGTVGTAVKVSLISSAVQLLTARCYGNIALSGCQRGKDRIKTLDDSRFAPDHHAIPALESPHSPAGP